MTVTRAVPRQWWSTWLEGHSRGMAPVHGGGNLQKPVSTTRATSTLAYSNPSPSSHGSEMVKTDQRGFILTKPKNVQFLFLPRNSCTTSISSTSISAFWHLNLFAKYINLRADGGGGGGSRRYLRVSHDGAKTVARSASVSIISVRTFTRLL